MAQQTGSLTLTSDPLVTTVNTNITALHTKVDKLTTKLDALAVAVSKIPTTGTPPVVTPPVVTPPVVTPPGTTSDWPLSEQPLDNTTVRVTAGLKTGAQHIEAAGVTLIGAGMRQTIIDGRGGAQGGNRFAYGKGQIHSSQNITIRGFGFKGNMDVNGSSDGEAGVYNEGGTTTIELCAFDSSENGCYMQPREFMAAGTHAYMNIDRCVFGRLASNGLNDGRSHDVYLGGDGATIKNSVFVGNSRGNTIKIRANRAVLNNNWIARSNGRWLDFPGGTECDSSGNTYITNQNAPSNNAMGFFDEADVVNTDRPGYFKSVNDTFIFGGHESRREVFWINGPGFVFSFVGAKVFWVGPQGSPPPQVIFSTDPGGGNLLPTQPGSPFVFSEANRLSAMPPIPVDPT